MTISEKQAQTFRFFQENEGRKFTAIDINLAVRTSDARKIISRLRRAGHRILDEIVNKSNGTKQYWYESESSNK